MKLLKTKEVTLKVFIDIYKAKKSSDIIWVVGEQIMAACGFYKPEENLKKLLETCEPEFRGLTLETEVNGHGFNNRKVLLFNFHGAMKLCAATHKFGAQRVIDALFDAIQNLEYENEQLRVVEDELLKTISIRWGKYSENK